jgi:signal transduction histidine kinase
MRLVGSFMLVILISVGILEILLMNFVQQYYYNNTEEILTNQIRISADFYARYFSNASLEDNIMANVDVFWNQTEAQVQILDLSGRVLMDSVGFMPKEPLQTNDVKKALMGEKGRWLGKVEYDSFNTMAVAYPLRSDEQIVGVLRFVTSLREVDRGIRNISGIFLAIGAFVIIVTGCVSVLLANSIVEPIKEVTGIASIMASGNLKVRSIKQREDEIGKLSDTLNFMADEILKKDRLKDDFISSVSHELRTPLTSIRGWVDTLNTEESLGDRPMLREGFAIIEKENERLTRMVEELLDFSRFVSGKVTLEKEQTEFAFFIEHIKRYMSPRSAREQIAFIVEYDEDLPAVLIDRNRIKQVMINILDNAFKFTPEGGKVLLKADADSKYLILSVVDNGCGISNEDLPKVKEKFYKGKSSKAQNGIGLSICDEIIKMHGGIFKIESELGKGTVVCVKLPL